MRNTVFHTQKQLGSARHGAALGFISRNLACLVWYDSVERSEKLVLYGRAVPNQPEITWYDAAEHGTKGHRTAQNGTERHRTARLDI